MRDTLHLVDWIWRIHIHLLLDLVVLNTAFCLPGVVLMLEALDPQDCPGSLVQLLWSPLKGISCDLSFNSKTVIS